MLFPILYFKKTKHILQKILRNFENKIVIVAKKVERITCKTCVRKTLTNCFNLHDANHFNLRNVTSKTCMADERTIDRIVNKTFQEIDSFSKFIIILKFLNKNKRESQAKVILEFF